MVPDQRGQVMHEAALAYRPGRAVVADDRATAGNWSVLLANVPLP
jgi:hypothetical protein